MKISVGLLLTATENIYNLDVSSDHLVVENFFVRLFAMGYLIS